MVSCKKSTEWTFYREVKVSGKHSQLRNLLLCTKLFAGLGVWTHILSISAKGRGRKVVTVSYPSPLYGSPALSKVRHWTISLIFHTGIRALLFIRHIYAFYGNGFKLMIFASKVKMYLLGGLIKGNPLLRKNARKVRRRRRKNHRPVGLKPMTVQFQHCPWRDTC